jgi:hypothetical protein
MFYEKIAKIALFEPELHHEVLELFLAHYVHIAENVSILTYSENIEYINETSRFQSNVTWCTFENRKKDERLIKQWISKQSDVDLFVWITLSPLWLNFSIEKLPVNSMLVIHNYHYWFDYENHKAPLFHHLKTIWHQWIYFFSYRQKQKRWLSRFRYWNSLVSFPFLLPQRIPPQHSTIKNNLSVVIPGSIRKNGRDYGLVIQLIEKLPSTMAIELVFLGDAGSHFARRFLISVNKIKPQSVKIIVFDHYVSEDLFRFYMQRATFLWIPLMPHRYYGGVLEKVGFSAITGGVLDAWKFQRNCFLPQWYPIPSDMKSLVLPYHHIDEIIQHISVSRRHVS